MACRAREVLSHAVFQVKKQQERSQLAALEMQICLTSMELFTQTWRLAWVRRSGLGFQHLVAQGPLGLRVARLSGCCQAREPNRSSGVTQGRAALLPAATMEFIS